MNSKQFFVYIATNPTNRVLYTGVTNDLIRRLSDHKDEKSKFTAKYHVTKLVYYEIYSDIRDAIEREKQIKAGSRRKKFDLITTKNSTFRDLYPEIL